MRNTSFQCLFSFYLNFVFFVYEKFFPQLKKKLTICSSTVKFYFKDNGIFTSCFARGSVGCRRWEERVSSCHRPAKPCKWWLHPFPPSSHTESDLFETRNANSCSFSKLQLLFIVRIAVSSLTQLPALAPVCLWTLNSQQHANRGVYEASRCGAEIVMKRATIRAFWPQVIFSTWDWLWKDTSGRRQWTMPDSEKKSAYIDILS